MTGKEIRSRYDGKCHEWAFVEIAAQLADRNDIERERLELLRESNRLQEEQLRHNYEHGTMVIKALTPASLSTAGTTDAQLVITQWAARCFGGDQVNSPVIRALRLVEEAIEFAQSVDADPEKLTALVDYVYARPKGEPAQELGGVAVTALVAASSIKVKFADVLDAEIARVMSKPVEHFAKRNQDKLDAGFNEVRAAAPAGSGISAKILESYIEFVDEYHAKHDDEKCNLCSLRREAKKLMAAGSGEGAKEAIEFSDARFTFDIFGNGRRNLWKAASMLCETRGHAGFRPCEFCAMQCGIKNIERASLTSSPGEQK